MWYMAGSMIKETIVKNREFFYEMEIILPMSKKRGTVYFQILDVYNFQNWNYTLEIWCIFLLYENYFGIL